MSGIAKFPFPVAAAFRALRVFSEERKAHQQSLLVLHMCDMGACLCVWPHLTCHSFQRIHFLCLIVHRRFAHLKFFYADVHVFIAHPV